MADELIGRFPPGFPLPSDFLGTVCDFEFSSRKFTAYALAMGCLDFALSVS